MSNAFRLFLVAFFSLSALVLSCIACAGSTKNYYPLNHIYAGQIDLTNLNVGSIISTATDTSNLNLDGLTAASIGLPSFINTGLWSYCIGNANGTITNCTSPHGIQKFNLKEMLYDNIEDNEILDVVESAAEIVLPDNLKDKISYVDTVIKCWFITLIIAIALSFVSLVFCILRWVIHTVVLNWIGCFFSFFCMAAFVVSMGAYTAAYIILRTKLNETYDEYGIKLSLGTIFLALGWSAFAASLLNFMCWCSVRSVRSAQRVYVSDSIEKKPLMY